MQKNVIKKLSIVQSADYVGNSIIQAGGGVGHALSFIMRILFHTVKKGNHVLIVNRSKDEMSILRRRTHC